MKCQNCNVNDANVNLAMNINNQKTRVHLCNDCFHQINMQAQNPNNLFGGTSKAFGSFNQFNQGNGPRRAAGTQVKESQAPGLLEQLGTNLTDKARQNQIDPVIGRDVEVKRVIEILNRRNKNNPVLIGEPGVGKTAIAEGLARKIVEGDVPTKLMNKEVYMLDVASLVANTGIRGQFEERMQELIEEVKQRDEVILFIDEIHLIVGAGTAESSKMDAGNILKPALARGEMQLIGATTLKEYRQIEKDAALERRLQPITVKEPTLEQAEQILHGIKDRYEKFHEVKYSDDVIKSFVTLSDRYIQERFLPDKAIDLMDEVGSRLNLANAENDSDSIQTQLEKVRAEKRQAADTEDYERAANLRYQEHQLEKQLEKSQGTENNTIDVDVSDVQLIVEEKTGIPVTKMQADEQSKMREIETNLGSKVIGQPEAVGKVAKAIRRSRAGLKSKYRPIGTFLFVGPTGVGKTELTKALAEELFGTRDSLIRLDMSEYMEKHSVSKIIGSPPGYVGHEEAGQLTEQVRRNPYNIILLDEIEKAHPDVQNMFLQIMEDGHLTDSHGRTVSFKETVIIMTSNAGTGFNNSMGFGQSESDAVSSLEMLSDYFKPEFLNRFDSIVKFNELNEENLLEIVDLMLVELNEAVKENEIELEITQEAKEKLVKMGYDQRFGARPLRRVIQDVIEDQLTDLMLEEDALDHVIAKVVDDAIVVENV